MANPILFEFNKLSNSIKFDALLEYPKERYVNRWESDAPLSGGAAITTHQEEQSRSYSLAVALGSLSETPRFIESEIQSLIGFSQKRILIGFTWEDFKFAPAILTQLQITRTKYLQNKCVQATFEITLDLASLLSFGGK